MNGKTGRRIIKKYGQMAGASKCTEFHGQPISCNAHSEQDVNCVYTAGKVKGEIGQCRKTSARDLEKIRSSSRTRDSLVKQFENDAGNRFLKSWKKKKFNKAALKAMSVEEQRKLNLEEEKAELLKQQKLKKIQNCANCGMVIDSYSKWNENGCDSCQNETELFGDDAIYFRLRRSELKNFSEKIYPMLYEMAGNDEDMVSRFITNNYKSSAYEEADFDAFKARFITNSNKEFMKFYKKVLDLNKEYTKMVKGIEDLTDSIHIEVFVNLDDDSMYYHNFDSNTSTYNLDDIISSYCSSASNAGECCKIKKCRWNGKLTTCKGKKGCKNVYSNSITNKGCNKSGRVKRNKTYRSSTSGTCVY